MSKEQIISGLLDIASMLEKYSFLADATKYRTIVMAAVYAIRASL